MKWKGSKEPKDFEERWVRGFALLPLKIDDTWVWLEHYSQLQFYSRTYRCWIDVSKDGRRLIAT